MNEIQPSSPRSFWRRVFLSPAEPRLRAGWRLVIQTIILLILLVGLTLPFSLAVLLLHLNPTGTVAFTSSTLITLIAFTLSIYVSRRWLDRRAFSSLGLQVNRYVLPDLLTGILITFILMGAIYLAMDRLGWIHFNGFAWQIDPWGVVLGQVTFFFFIFILVGWQEELLSRGYHLQTLASGLNLLWGVVLSSAIFGLLHLGNPNATWVSAAGIFFAGVFLALGFVWTGRLWLSIGLHIGWNFFEGVVFGFPVSGLATYPLLRIQVSGPAAWTGGAFGPEAGLIVLPALLLGAGLIYGYTRWRGRERPKI